MTTSPAFAARPERAWDRAFERARLTVVPSRRVKAARMPFVTLVSLVLLGGVVGLLCFNTQMQQASFAETKLQAQATTLSAREQTLHDQVQALRDPQHLAAAAQRAGMVIPETACTLRLGTGVTDDACTAATNANTPPLQGRAPGKPAVINPPPQVTVVQATTPATTTATTATTDTGATGATGATVTGTGAARHQHQHQHRNR